MRSRFIFRELSKRNIKRTTYIPERDIAHHRFTIKSNRFTMSRKITYDQEKVKELRMKVIEDSLLVFSNDEKNKKKINKWTQYRKDLLMKYASRVLPTLIAGKDDDSDLMPKPPFDYVKSRNNNRNRKDKRTKEES